MGKHQLLGAEVSYYTGKVRAYLRYKHIPFEEVAATREVYRDVIVPRTGVRFIPVLIADDDVVVQDSTAIVDFLEQRVPEPALHPAGPVQQLASLLFEVYGDEWLLLPAMHYRWNVPENRAFAIEEFGRLSVPGATPEEHRAIGEKLAGPFAGALPTLGVSAQTAPAIEASYLGFLDAFAAHLRVHPFLLGARPALGDFALYGPLYAHLYRDPASGRLMRARAPEVAAWVERMTSPPETRGPFVDDDLVPATLEPLLARLFGEFGPLLEVALARLDALTLPAGEPLPRGLGTHAFRLGDAEGERTVRTFNVWRWQRAHDHYGALTPEARARADALLGRVGGGALMAQPIARRLARVNNRLVFAAEQ
ncbi:MAG: glutathione S-transferase family protein [Polyangiales bacterium]